MSTASNTAEPQDVAANPDLPSSLYPGVRGVMIVSAVVALADFLLYRRPLGISLVVFLLVLAAGALCTNSARTRQGAVRAAAACLVAGLLPFAVNPGAISLAFALSATALFAVLMFTHPRLGAWNAFAATRALAASVVHRAPVDAFKAIQDVARKRPKSPAGLLLVWFVPLTLGLVFAALFAHANPVIDRWISAIDLTALFAFLTAPLEGARVAFWLILAMLVWPVLFVQPYQAREPRQRARPSGESHARVALSAVLSDAAILRALIVFNALFAVQTVLDAAYLWGGMSLPDGMTYAAYARRGAYALMITALLAAAFVIVALKPGSHTERTPLIRALVYVWIAQTLVLVASAILRLNLYVAAYSLTHWRVAAFIWMLVVAVGLVLILARIALGRSNEWLVGANLISLGVTLYLCAFVNFASLIANYNVTHSAEMGGAGPPLHRMYLRNLGPHAIPAADTFLARHPDRLSDFQPVKFFDWRAQQETALRVRLQDWRAWNYWDWRLVRYLDATEAPRSITP